MPPLPDIITGDLVLPQGCQGAGNRHKEGEDDQSSPTHSFANLDVETEEGCLPGQPAKRGKCTECQVNPPSMFLWVDNQKISFNDDQEQAIGESNLERVLKGDIKLCDSNYVCDKRLLTVLLVARKRRSGISWRCELLQLSN